MREAVAHICELRDRAARTRFWDALYRMPLQELPGKHWRDTGVEHWRFLTGQDELMVCEDYEELNIYGPPELLQRVVAVAGGQGIGEPGTAADRPRCAASRRC
jgi:hypothetical protein